MKENAKTTQRHTWTAAIALFVWTASAMAGAVASATPAETPRNPNRRDVSTSFSSTIAMRMVGTQLQPNSPNDMDSLPMEPVTMGRTPLYPGVTFRTLRSGPTGHSLEFAVTPGFDAAVITLQFSEAVSMTLADQGNLRLQTYAGESSLGFPTAFQQALFEKRPVAVAYQVSDDGTVTLSVGESDDMLPLLIQVPLQGVSLVMDSANSTSESVTGLR